MRSVLPQIVIVSLIATSCFEVEAQSFRRILIPQNRLTDFVDGMRPMSRTDFEAIVKPQDKAEIAPFNTAVYEAVINNGTLVGTGTLQVNQTNKSKFLPLDGDLAITKSNWRSEDALQPAIVGQNKYGAVVIAESRFRDLEIAWRNHGRRSSDESNAWRFSVEFPQALAQELQLTTSPGVSVYANHSIVRPIGNRPNGDVIWAIRWSGNTLELVVKSIHKPRRAQSHSRYVISEREVRVTSSFLFDGGEIGSSFKIEKSPELEVIDARWGEQSLLFQQSSNGQHVQVELPGNRNLDQEFQVVVHAVAKPKLFGRSRLPWFRLDGHEGGSTVQLLVPPPLSVMDLRLEQCVCESMEVGDGIGESYRFRLEARKSDIQFVLDYQNVDFRCESISQVTMRDKSVTAAVEFQIQPQRGDLVELDFQVKNGWNIVEDSIQVRSNSGTLDNNVDFEHRSSELGRLELELSQPATTTQPIYVRVLLQTVLDRDVISPADLIPLTVLNAVGQESYLYVENTPGLRLQLSRAQFGSWLDLENAPPWMASSLDSSGVQRSLNDMFLRVTPDGELVNIGRSIVAALPEIESVTRVEFGASNTTYSLDVYVDPQGRELDELVVVFSGDTQSEDWSLVGRAEVPLVAVRKTKNNLERQHRVRFRPTDQPFQLLYEFTIPNSEELTIPLAAYPGTEGGRGIVGLLVGDTTQLEVLSAPGIETLPFSAIEDTPDKERKYRGVYRYDATSSVPPVLQIKRTERLPQASAWIWRADLRSYYSDSGRPQHRADLYIQSEGVSELKMRLPQGATFKSAEVNGALVDTAPLPIGDGNELALNLQLSVFQRYPCVSVTYLEEERPLYAVDWLTPPTLETELPKLQETWQVWLPRDFRVHRQEDLSSATRLAGAFGSPIASTTERSLASWLQRKMMPSIDDSGPQIRQIQILLGPDFMLESADENLWGPRIREISAKIRRSQPAFRMYVDREELRRIGVFADSQLPTDDAALEPRSPWSIGISRLAQAGLVLVFDGEVAILTSSVTAKSHARNSDWLDQVSLEGKLGWFGGSRLLDAESWSIEGLERLWRPTRDELETGIQQAGWQSTRVDITSRPVRLKIYHANIIFALQSIFVCLGLGVGRWLSRRNWRLVWMTAIGAFAFALSLPYPGSSLACALAWSLFAGQLFWFIAKSRHNRSALSLAAKRFLSPQKELSATRVAVWLVAVASGWNLLTGVSVGQEETPTSSPGREAFVYIPFNEDQEPGNTVYVPPELYQTIRKVAQERASQREVLLTKSKFTGFVSRDASINLSAQYELITTREGARLKLPELAKGNSVDLGSVMVNQAPAVVESVAGQPFVLLRRSGDHRISFDIECEWNSSIHDRRIELELLPTPNATLELKVPRGLGLVRVPSALGEVVHENGSVSAILGPTQRLEVVADITSATRDADWAKVNRIVRLLFGRDSTLMDVEFEFVDDSTSSLLLRLDSQIQTRNGQTIRRWRPSERNKLRFRLPSATGRFVVPAVQPLNATVDRSSIIVSSDGFKDVRLDRDLDSAVDITEDVEPGAGADLRLSTRAELPTFEVVNASATENWSADSSFFFDHRATRVEVKAQLTPTHQDFRQITVRRLRVPLSFRVERLFCLSSDGISQAIRWHRNDDEISVFFLDRLEASSTAPVELTLVGQLEGGADDNVSLPLVELINGSGIAKARNAVKIYRAADLDITIEIEGIGPFARSNIDLTTVERTGYVVHSIWTSETQGFQAAPDALVVSRSSVPRKIESSLTTRLMFDGEWAAIINANLRSSHGIEVLYLDVPSSLCDPKPSAFVGDEAPEPLRVEVTRGGPKLDRAILAIWLPPTTPEKANVFIKAKLEPGQTRLPHIRVINGQTEKDGSQQQFVELPETGQGTAAEQKFTWRKGGLTPVASPRSNYQKFRVTQSDYQALLEEQPSGIRPEATLVSTRCAWLVGGEFIATSEFFLNPARETRILVRLPDGADLLQAFTDGNQVAFSKTASKGDEFRNCHQLTLAASPWPQRIRFIYQGFVVQDGNIVTLTAPQLLYADGIRKLRGVQVEEEIWTVDAPKGDVNSTQASGDVRTSLRLVDKTKIDAFVRLWSKAQNSIRTRPRSERLACVSTWARYLNGPIVRSQSTNQGEEDWQALGEVMSEFAGAFIVHPNPQAVSEEVLWDETRWTTGKRLIYESLAPQSQQPPTLSLKFHPEDGEWKWTRHLLAGLLVGFGGLVCVLDRRGWEIERVFENPFILVGVVGVIWRVFLSPTWIGSGILITVLLFWLRTKIRSRRLHSRFKKRKLLNVR